MSGEIIIRAPVESDFPQLAALDLRYSASRVLALSRDEGAGEHRFAFRWKERAAADAVYNTYGVERLRGAMQRVDLMAVAECDRVAVALMMVMVPAWTDAAEITDLAIDARYRRRGIGRALVERAEEFARERALRALWVEPRSDNAAAIEFYLSSGFRLSGFNDRMYSNRDDEDGRVTLFMHKEVKASPNQT